MGICFDLCLQDLVNQSEVYIQRLANLFEHLLTMICGTCYQIYHILVREIHCTECNVFDHYE